MELYGKKHALAVLSGFRRSGRFPHALLFCGPAGIGKHTLADCTAMMYLCEDKDNAPCMECQQCRRIERHIHPDVVYPIPAIEEAYKKQSSTNKKPMTFFMRRFITSCYSKPNDGNVRVIVFEKLDELSVILQNTLLKFIEEPLDFNRYIFLAESKTPILQTVLSRVTAVEVDGADEADFLRAMTDNGIDPALSSELYRRTGGNVGEALSYENGGSEQPYLAAAVNALDALAAKKELDCLNAFLTLKTRDEIFDALGIMSDVFAQTAAVRSGKSPQGAYRQQTQRLAAAYSLRTVTRLYEESVRLYGMSFTNPNVRLLAAECSSALFNAAEKP